jgi:hypothetical protein
MADKWVLTWERTAFVQIGRRHLHTPRRERKTFNSQKEAVNFAMSLDEPQQRTVQLHFPDGDIAYLPRIEQIYAEHQRTNKSAGPKPRALLSSPPKPSATSRAKFLHNRFQPSS